MLGIRTRRGRHHPHAHVTHVDYCDGGNHDSGSGTIGFDRVCTACGWTQHLGA